MKIATKTTKNKIKLNNRKHSMCTLDRNVHLLQLSLDRQTYCIFIRAILLRTKNTHQFVFKTKSKKNYCSTQRKKKTPSDRKTKTNNVQCFLIKINLCQWLWLYFIWIECTPTSHRTQFFTTQSEKTNNKNQIHNNNNNNKTEYKWKISNNK